MGISCYGGNCIYEAIGALCLSVLDFLQRGVEDCLHSWRRFCRKGRQFQELSKNGWNQRTDQRGKMGKVVTKALLRNNQDLTRWTAGRIAEEQVRQLECELIVDIGGTG